MGLCCERLYNPLVEDADLRDAPLYRLHTLAESTQHLSPEPKTAHPEIPWDDIAAFRNRIVNGYLGVSLDIVWDIIQQRPAAAREPRPDRASICAATAESRAKIGSRPRILSSGADEGEHLFECQRAPLNGFWANGPPTQHLRHRTGLRGTGTASSTPTKSWPSPSSSIFPSSGSSSPTPRPPHPPPHHQHRERALRHRLRARGSARACLRPTSPPGHRAERSVGLGRRVSMTKFCSRTLMPE